MKWIGEDRLIWRVRRNRDLAQRWNASGPGRIGAQILQGTRTCDWIGAGALRHSCIIPPDRHVDLANSADDFKQELFVLVGLQVGIELEVGRAGDGIVIGSGKGCQSSPLRHRWD